MNRATFLTKKDIKILETIFKHDELTSMSEISKKSGYLVSNISHTINKLTRLKYIKKIKIPNSRQSTELKLTKKGLEVVERL